MKKAKLRAGILGYGGIGHFHAANYADQKDCVLAAVADIDPARLKEDKAEINLGGSGEAAANFKRYRSYEEMVKHEALDFIDICLPTDLHSKYAVKAMRDGYHVLSEKPMARTLAQAKRMVDAAERYGRYLMIAHCLRFYPVYEYLKKKIDDGSFGPLRRLSMQRLSGAPATRPWFLDGKRSGGALLDMHIHDTDMVHHLFGVPEAVVSFGCANPTKGGDAFDEAMTNYLYPGIPAVSAETSWSSAGFRHGFLAVFEEASILFDNDPSLVKIARFKKPVKIVKMPAGNGYAREIAYFAHAVRTGGKLDRCPAAESLGSLKILFAEERSIRTGRKVALPRSAD